MLACHVTSFSGTKFHVGTEESKYHIYFKHNKSTKLFHMNLFPNQIFDPSRCSASKPVGRRTRECHRARSPGSQGVVVCAVRFGPIQKQVILILNPAARTIWHLLQKQEMENEYAGKSK